MTTTTIQTIQTRFTVIYRTGGPGRFEWRKTLLAGTYAEMHAEACKLASAGHKALIHDAHLLHSIGLPDTWD